MFFWVLLTVLYTTEMFREEADEAPNDFGPPRPVPLTYFQRTFLWQTKKKAKLARRDTSAVLFRRHLVNVGRGDQPQRRPFSGEMPVATGTKKRLVQLQNTLSSPFFKR